jgi:hypothetical protein
VPNGNISFFDGKMNQEIMRDVSDLNAPEHPAGKVEMLRRIEEQEHLAKRDEKIQRLLIKRKANGKRFRMEDV